MAKLPWYMKEKKSDNGFNIVVHPLWICYQKLKIKIKRLFNYGSNND